MPIDDAISPQVAEALTELQARAQLCVRLTPGGTGRSRLGGVPDMAGSWPRYEGRPLSCVAQLDLAELRAVGGPEWLPDQGRLLFFYELEHGGWGIGPEDAGSSVVIHETGPAVAAVEPDDLPQDFRAPAYPVAMVQDRSFPGEERLTIDWAGLDAASVDALQQAIDDLLPPSPAHQIGGYPFPVQNDEMEAECQRVAGGGRGEAADWRLLLQLDTDDDAGMMWCDVGTLYFWVREQDARAGDFSKIWMILQSN